MSGPGVIPVVQQWSTAIQAHESHREQPAAYARLHRLSASGNVPLVRIQMHPCILHALSIGPQRASEVWNGRQEVAVRQPVRQRFRSTQA